jgi:hypothetical protein
MNEVVARRTPDVAIRLWNRVAAARARGLTAQAAEQEGICSESYARRALRRWAAGGFLDRRDPDSETGSFRYFFNDASPEVPPILATDGRIAERHPAAAMSAGEFGRIRAKLADLSLSDIAERLGYEGHPNNRSRSMRRFLSGERPIDDTTAAKIRALEP